MTEARLLTMSEAMIYLGIKSRLTMRSLMAKNDLKNVSIDRVIRFDKNDLDLLIEKKKLIQTKKVS